MQQKMQQLSNLDEQDELDQQKAVVNPHHSPYDQVKTEVQKFKGLCSGTLAVWQNFEKPLRCKISRNDWLKLQEDLDLNNENEDHFPRYSYDASTSTLIIEISNTPVHETLIKFLNGYINRVSDVETTTNEDIRQFAEKYDGLKRAPDLGIFESDGIKNSLKWLLEVSFSETYEHVKEKIVF